MRYATGETPKMGDVVRITGRPDSEGLYVIRVQKDGLLKTGYNEYANPEHVDLVHRPVGGVKGALGLTGILLGTLGGVILIGILADKSGK